MIRIVCFEDKKEMVGELRKVGDVQAFLRKAEWELEPATIEKIRKFDPELAVVDLQYRENKMAGVRVVRKLSAAFPDMPIAVWTILLTDDPNGKIKAMIEDLGARPLRKGEDLQMFVETLVP
jgi:hypothetical protein